MDSGRPGRCCRALARIRATTVPRDIICQRANRTSSDSQAIAEWLEGESAIATTDDSAAKIAAAKANDPTTNFFTRFTLGWRQSDIISKSRAVAGFLTKCGAVSRAIAISPRWKER